MHDPSTRFIDASINHEASLLSLITKEKKPVTSIKVVYLWC
jgi:hypothetical protein